MKAFVVCGAMLFLSACSSDDKAADQETQAPILYFTWHGMKFQTSDRGWSAAWIPGDPKAKNVCDRQAVPLLLVNDAIKTKITFVAFEPPHQDPAQIAKALFAEFENGGDTVWSFVRHKKEGTSLTVDRVDLIKTHLLEPQKIVVIRNVADDPERTFGVIGTVEWLADENEMIRSVDAVVASMRPAAEAPRQ